MRNKYYNRKTMVDGIQFDSKAEANRYKELKLLHDNGYIEDLILQPIFELQPSFRRNGKTIRAITYKADFGYFEGNNYIVEDVKGYCTDVYKIKRKMLQYLYPQIIFKEVK